MNTLRMANQYLDLVVRRSKKTTIRLGYRAVTKNERLLLGDELGREVSVRVTKVIVKLMTELNLTDAMADGFQNLSELLSNLHQLYPESSEDDLFTIIEFEVIDPL